MSIFMFLGAMMMGGILPFTCPDTRYLRMVAYAWSTGVFGLGVYLAIYAFSGSGLVGMWYLDAAAGLMVLLIAFMQWTAVLVSAPLLAREVEEGSITIVQARLYFALLALFTLSMAITVLANNLAIVWIALEATTLATTLLVAFYSKKGSLEAAWKYLILCSTGIALGFIGVLLAVFAGKLGGLDAELAANWSDLFGVAASLNPDILKLAFIFVLIGYGTKAGLAPMHAWLPDAHSKAPAPISGLLSGVLLPVALFAVLRFKWVTDLSVGDGMWTGTLLIIFGSISVVVAAFFILVQQDYKRLLAYSSTEHMGLIAICFGLGGIGAIAGTVHLAAHALIKSALFYGAGSILARCKTTQIRGISGLMAYMPKTGALFLFGLLALLAMPPSPLFMSEYLLVFAGLGVFPWMTALILLALVIVLSGFLRQLMPLLFAPQGELRARGKEELSVAHGAIAAHYALVVLAGVLLWTPGGFAVAEKIAHTFAQ